MKGGPLDGLRRLLRAYPTLLLTGLAEAVAYRAEFIVWMLSMTMPLVMLAVMSAVAREAPIGRFDERGFVSYYLATLIVRQTTGAWVMYELVREIREGTLSLRLLRPIHPLASYSADSLAAMPLRAVIALPVTLLLLVTTSGRDVSSDPLILAGFVVSLFFAWLLNFSVSALVGTLSLFIDSSQRLWDLWLGCFMLLSGYLVPLSLFPPWLERAVRFLPFPYLQAVPVELLIGLRDRHQALVSLGLQASWALGAFLLLLLVWRRGVRRYAAFGG